MHQESMIARLSFDPPRQGVFTWQGNTLIFTPDQPWPVGATVKVHLASGGKAAGWIALPLSEEYTWSFHVRRPRLLYLFPADQQANLYLYDPSTGETQPLTQNDRGLLDYTANLDGSLIYFSAPVPQGGSEIYRLVLTENFLSAALPGALPTPRLQIPAAQPLLFCPQALCQGLALSPGGDYLAYERIAQPETEEPQHPRVWYVRLPKMSLESGATPPPLPEPTLAGEAQHQTFQPLWSPDGRLSFYDKTAAAYVIEDIRSGTQVQFPNQTGQMGAWSPDGKEFVAAEIFFPNVSDQTGLNQFAYSQLLAFDPQSRKTRSLTPEEDLENASPAYSPDGAYLALARKYLDTWRWSPGRQLWVLRTAGGQAEQMTNEPNYTHFDFTWSPGSDQLAYVRFNQTQFNEPPEIWIFDLFTRDSRRLVIGGYAPQWIP
jgi:Tol biopolymer transport system component